MTLVASWEAYMQVKKQQLEPDMEQWTGSKLWKEYDQAINCHPDNLMHPIWVLHSICQQTWKTQQGPQDWKRSVFIPVPKKGSAK